MSHVLMVQPLLQRRRLGRLGCGHGLSLEAPVVCLGFGWWDVADGFQQPMVVEPRDPFKRGQFDRHARPGVVEVFAF